MSDSGKVLVTATSAAAPAGRPAAAHAASMRSRSAARLCAQFLAAVIVVTARPAVIIAHPAIMARPACRAGRRC